jgi:two-component system, sensor histidine kinase and response regulator
MIGTIQGDGMGAETILVVEDDAVLGEVLKETLEAAGYDVASARDGLEGLALLERVRPDLVLSDIRMPRMNGYAFYSEMRARPQWASTPFIFLTALGDTVQVRYGKELGADDYLIKPVLAEDLLVAVRARLKHRARLETARELQIGQLKDSILTTLNHELRTPLTTVSGYSDLLRELGSSLSAEQLRQSIEGILRGSDRLKRLSEDLATLVEMRSGEAQKGFEQRRSRLRDVPTLLRGALHRHERFAASRNVRLVDEVPEQLPEITADPKTLTDAVQRLVENGIKFSRPAGGQVALRARELDQSLEIVVVDDGIGMPKDQLETISEMFYQVDRARHEQQGSGSGLTIVRGIVMMHAGTLRVTSEPGQGSTCTIELPLSGPS